MPTPNLRLASAVQRQCIATADAIETLHVDQWAEWIYYLSEELETRLPEQEADQFVFDVISRLQDRLHRRGW